MQIKVKIISENQPVEVYEFHTEQEVMDFFEARTWKLTEYVPIQGIWQQSSTWNPSGNPDAIRPSGVSTGDSTWTVSPETETPPASPFKTWLKKLIAVK